MCRLLYTKHIYIEGNNLGEKSAGGKYLEYQLSMVIMEA